MDIFALSAPPKSPAGGLLRKQFIIKKCNSQETAFPGVSVTIQVPPSGDRGVLRVLLSKTPPWSPFFQERGNPKGEVSYQGDLSSYKNYKSLKVPLRGIEGA
jgi:hypothetical protein